MVLTRAIDVIAQSSNTPSFGVFADYLNLGVIVVVLVLAYTRKVRFEGEVKEKEAEIAALKETLKEYTQHYQTEVLPALIEVTRVSGEVVSFLNKRGN
jgi:hypothetical protein